MNSLKIKLLAATALAVSAMPAHAQFSYPTVELRGLGASSIADIHPKVNDCIGTNVTVGKSDGTSSTVTPAGYLNTGAPSNGKPSLSCDVPDGVNTNIYNGSTTYKNLYVSSGSGLGREEWRLFSNRFDGTSGKIFPTTGDFNGVTAWPHVQYAFSDSPASASDITAYNSNAGNSAGNAIQFPLYVFPIAFAYNPTYGDNGGTPLVFNNQNPQTTNGVASGGIKLTKAAYCGIWNGTITNWNNATLTTLNNNTPLFDTTNDSASRWTSEGAPIRLVGRADKSGTTDLFTRALAAQCAGTKFVKSAESLPFPASGTTIDIRPLRSDSQYFPNNASSTAFAGSTLSLSGYVADKNGNICFWNEISGGVCPASPAAVTFAQFNTGGTSAGLFIVADGSGNVEKAVRQNTGANAALVSPSNASITLNGKLGYLSADFVAGSTGRTLHAAALQQGTSKTVFLMPNTKNATTAFGKVLPPQTSSSGTYVADTRTIYQDLTNTGAGTTSPVRTNPLHWVNVLYPTTGVTLANPTSGYPVTGAANFLTYTCFDSEAKRAGIANYLGHLFGNIKKKAVAGGTPSSISLSANTFKGNTATEVGILTKSNIALVPTAWQKSITETFLKNSTNATVSAMNLWIQSAQATSASSFTAVTSNSQCAVDGAGTLPGA